MGFPSFPSLKKGQQTSEFWALGIGLVSRLDLHALGRWRYGRSSESLNPGIRIQGFCSRVKFTWLFSREPQFQLFQVLVLIYDGYVHENAPLSKILPPHLHPTGLFPRILIYKKKKERYRQCWLTQAIFFPISTSLNPCSQQVFIFKPA